MAAALDLAAYGFRRLREVRNAPTGFLQVFVDEVTLAPRPGSGVCVTLTIRDDAFALTRPGARRDLDPAVDRDEGRALAGRLAALRRGDAAAAPEVVRLRRFPLRHASAGAHVRLARAGEAAVDLLFFRDIHPVGWNIANGGSATEEELTDIAATLLRECAEEVLFWAPSTRRLLQVAAAPGEAERARAHWRRRLGPDPELLIATLEGTWDSGPDAVRVVGADGRVAQTDGIHLSVNVDDFALEIARVVTLRDPGGLVPLDGELAGDALLDRPIGLFRRDGVADSPWEPDVVYRSAALLTAAERPWTAPPPLCPVTRALLSS